MANCTHQTLSLPEQMSEVNDLKLIGNEDLDRTWKHSIRERQKMQEKKIWEDFCKDQDNILNAVLEEDPYQFFDIIPEASIDKILQSDHTAEEPVYCAVEIQQDDSIEQDDPVISHDITVIHQHDITVEEHCDEDIETQYASGDRCLDSSISRASLLGSDKDDDLEQAAVETVIEQPIDIPQDINLQLSDRAEENLQTPHTCEIPAFSEDITNKTTEEDASADSFVKEMPPTFRSTVTFETLISKRITYNAQQSSMYFDKVKEWRTKINQILICIMELFERDVVDDLDPHELKKSLKRASEFATRFTRIYVYQLQRQLNDLKRHMNVTLPFGKRTQFQAQATRVLSLHQNTLQALQMIHHPLEKSLVLAPGGQPLQSVLDYLMESTETCRLVSPSQDVKARVAELYNDEIPISCIKLEQIIQFYTHTCQSIVDHIDIDSPRSSNIRQNDRIRKPAPKKLNLPYGKSQMPTKQNKVSSRYATGTKFSSNSLENTQKTKCSREKNLVDKGTDKPGSSVSQLNLITKPIANQATNTRKLDRSGESERKKLTKKSSARGMRRNKLKKKTIDEDVVTMVQTVNNVTISNYSSSRTETCAEIPKYSSPRTPRIVNFAAQEPALPLHLERKAAAAAAGKAEGGGGGGAGGSARGAQGGGGGGCNVTALLHRLCGSSGEVDEELLTRTTRVTGAANAQLQCVRRESPRAPAASPRAHRPPSNNPQLLKILEENIQKQPPTTPRGYSHSRKIQTCDPKNVPEKYLLQFDTPQGLIDSSNQYRKQFIEYMMSSPMYLNNSFSKPWEVVARFSDRIVEDLILDCAREMQLDSVLTDLYNAEVN